MKKLFFCAALLISVLFGDESFELNATNPIKIDIISLKQNKVNLKNIIPQSTPNELAALTLYSQKEAINEHNIILASGKDFVALIDTGYEKTIDELKTALNARALTPEQITHVIITHSHQDHIGGVKALPNAQILVNEKELGFWQEKSSTKGLNIKTFAPNTELINGSGIYAIAAYGHTPGHSVIAFGASGTNEAELFASAQFLFVADIFHAYELQAAAPVVAVVWDHNKADAIEARKKVINALKAHKTSFIGTHMPYSKRVKFDENSAKIMANLIQSEYIGLLKAHSNEVGLSNGKELYNNICAACHGSKADVKYAGVVPNLCDVDTIADYAWHYKKGTRNRYNMAEVMQEKIKTLSKQDFLDTEIYIKSVCPRLAKSEEANKEAAGKSSQKSSTPKAQK